MVLERQAAMDGAKRVERITKRSVDACEPGERLYRLWDSDLKGFGLRVTPQGVKSYFVYYRAGGGRSAAQKEYTIGRHGPLTPEKGRTAAERILAAVSLGEDPQSERVKARNEMTLADLCDLYMREGVATKKPLTVSTDHGRIDVHIKPLLGARPISTITSADIERFMQDVAAGKSAVKRKTTASAYKAACRAARAAKAPAPPKPELRGRRDRVAKGGKGAATRAMGLLGGIFTFAVKRKLLTENPTKGVARYPDRHSQRFLSGEELNRLAIAMDEAAETGANAHGLAVIRLLVLTGARKSEIERLRWQEVDFERSCLRLPDSKTGARVVQIGAAALKVLADLRGRGRGSGFVFPSSDAPTKAYIGTPGLWANRIRPAAKLEGVRLHDLRHTYASLAAAGGQSLPVIGAILGHRNFRTTAQYAHLADQPVKLAADSTAEAAAAAMAGRAMGRELRTF